MNYIGQIIEFLQRFFIWWVTIMPWEQAVHVRAGKKVRILSGGIHLRIPFIDRVYVQTTRLRVLEGKPQTVTTSDDKVITVVMAIGYSITDILKLYNGLYQAEQTLSNIVQAAVAKVIRKRPWNLLTCLQIEEAVMEELKTEEFGLQFEYVNVIGYALVKTLRLIQDGHYLPDALNTTTQKA